MSVDLKTPWVIAPLHGKYYGTVIEDAEGTEIMKVAIETEGHDAHPSERESIPYDHVSDWHYESRGTLEYAREIVRRINTCVVR